MQEGLGKPEGRRSGDSEEAETKLSKEEVR